MTIQRFAEVYRLKLKPAPRAYKPGPQPDRSHVPGARGWITEAPGGLLKVFIATHRVQNVLTEARQLGMVNQGRGDSELVLWLDPERRAQVDFATRTIRARKRRIVVVTPELRERLARIRKAPSVPFLGKSSLIGARFSSADPKDGLDIEPGDKPAAVAPSVP